MLSEERRDRQVWLKSSDSTLETGCARKEENREDEPNSKTTFLRFEFAEAICIARPVRVLPVKEIALIFMWEEIALPDIWP
jgi:hypothetical protein